MKAPEIQRYIDSLDPGISGYLNPSKANYTAESMSLLDELFSLVGRYKPNEGLCLLFFTKAERGTIDEFGDYNDYLEEGEVETYEEFEDLWKSQFPDNEIWYRLEFREDSGYRVVLIDRKRVIHTSPEPPEDYLTELDISDFVRWLIEAVKNCEKEILAGTYTENLNRELPYFHRTGYLYLSELWELRPQYKSDYFKNLTAEETVDFLRYANLQKKNGGMHERLEEMTANDFFSFCAMGYRANGYKNTDLSPVRQYQYNADGRDDGLLDIDPDSPGEFEEWLNTYVHIGHPWEVCKGGSQTHISLYAEKDKNGYYLALAGNSLSRAVETIKFYTALRRDGVPVVLDDEDYFTAIINGTAIIGIVPACIWPAYCSQYFPDIRIADAINLPFEETEKYIQKTHWYPVKGVDAVDDANKT